MTDRVAFKVDKIPKLADPQLDSVEQWAGQLPIFDGDEDDLMFFWLISNSTNTQNDDSLVVWLNGGPGCSSVDGVLMENGPYDFKDDQLHMRQHAWSTQMDVLYIDQPFGTGLSHANKDKYAKTFVESTEYLIKFLEKFYGVFPEYKERKLYIAGESEAGTYLIYLADAILKQESNKRLNLQGVMIGNGWIDGFTMYQSYPDILRENGILTDAAKKDMYNEVDKCVSEYNRAPQPVHAPVCESILDVFLKDHGPAPDLCYNIYDLRLNDTKPACGMNWPESVGNMTSYMQREDVYNALNIRPGKAPTKWIECNDGVSRALRDDKSKPAISILPSVLESVPVLLFVGDRDLICNYIGIEWMISNMTWNGEQGFTMNEESEWTIDGEQTGIYRSERNLTYVRIYNSSHMTGVDHPREMLDILTRFTNASTANIPFHSQLKTIKVDTGLSSRTDDKKDGGKFMSFIVLLIVVVLGVLAWMYRKRLISWWKARTSSVKSGMFSLGRSNDDLANDSQEHELDDIRQRNNNNSAQFMLYDTNDFDDSDDSDDDFRPNNAASYRN